MFAAVLLALVVSIPSITAAPCKPEDIFMAAAPVMGNLEVCATDSGYDFTALGQVPTQDQLKKIQNNKNCQDALTKLKGVAPKCDVKGADGKTMTVQQAVDVFLTSGQLPVASIGNTTLGVHNMTMLPTSAPNTSTPKPDVQHQTKPSPTNASSANAMLQISGGVATLMALSVLFSY